MMTIKDLSVSKDLDRAAMTEVRGGQVINSVTAVDQDLDQNNHGGVAIAAQEGTALSSINAAELNFTSFSGYVPGYKKPEYKRVW